MDDWFEAAQKWAEQHLGAVPDGHDFDHTLRVLKHAEALCDAYPQADREVVRIAAVLHDIARPEELAGCGRPDHALAGAEMAATFLREAGAPAALAEVIAGCIREHRYRSDRQPSTLEAQILFDADKLDSLGAAGIGRAFLFAGRLGARLHNRPEEALAGTAYGREDTAYREYLVKLRKLPEALQTEAGRLRAEALLGFMAEFFRQLDREIYPEKIAKN